MHRGPSLLSSTDSEHLVLGVWLTGPDADVCVCTECVWLTGPDADVCVCTECVWLTGPDADVCLSRVGHCQRTSAKHAVIFYDQVSCLSSLSLSLSLSVSVPSVTTHMDWTTWKSQGIASGHGKVRGNRNQVLQACKDKHIEWWNGSLALVAFCYGLAFSALTLFVGWQEGHLACKKIGGWWRCALLSPDGVAPSRMVGVSASVNFPLHHKVQKFSSGTGSPGWSRKKGRKTLVCVCVLHFAMAIPQLWYITGSK